MSFYIVPTKCWHCISTMDKGCEPFDEYTLGAERLHECWPNGPCVVATSKNTGKHSILFRSICFFLIYVMVVLFFLKYLQ